MNLSLLKKSLILFSFFAMLITVSNNIYANTTQNEAETVSSVDESSIVEESEEVTSPESDEDETTFLAEDESSEI